MKRALINVNVKIYIENLHIFNVPDIVTVVSRLSHVFHSF